jgi:hypothetical protein
MSRPVVVFLDLHAPEVRAAIQAECPPDVVLRMATSRDPAFLEQAQKVNKVVAYKGPEAFRQFQDEEHKKYLPLAIKMGIRK